MTGIAARNFVVLAGAVFFLHSCVTPQPGAKRYFGKEEAKGFNDNWGFDPQGKPTDPPGVNVPPYEPNYITVVIVDLAPQWTIDVHHASFPLDPMKRQDEVYRLEKAKSVIAWVLANPDSTLGDLAKETSNQPNHIPYKREKGDHAGQHHVPSLRDFRFKSQNEIFFFLKSSNIVINPQRVFRVTRYSEDIVRPMNLNCSLFNGRSVEPHNLGSLNGKGYLLRLENYVTGCDGKPSVSETYYSLNIHFKMKTKSGMGPQQYVPMIIDPDTGNGTGNEP